MNRSVWRRRPWFLPEGRRLPEDLWARRHRGLTLALWAHLPVLLVFGLLRGEHPATVAMELSALLVPAGAGSLPFMSRAVRSAGTSVGLVMAASVLVHLSGGAIEAHFHFFVILAFLTLYQAWLPFLLALAYVVVEHGLVGVLDPSSVYNHAAGTAHPWRYAFIHGGFVLAASFANVLSWRLTEQESLRDGLTGLPNRAALLDALDKTLEGRKGTAVLFIDLDNFKDANDAFGHHVGDQMLIEVARRLQGRLRSGDVLARLGGDEFAVVLTDVPSCLDARSAAEDLLHVLQDEELRIGDVVLTVEASMGVARADGTTKAADLLRNADLAMYEAKRDGGGRLETYRPGLHTAALRRTELEAELRVALEREQFVLHYQPIIDLGTQRIVGTEALVRWQHPTRGLVGPDEFITAAEQSGLVVKLGAWVVRTACEQAAEWQKVDPDLTIAVNLSPRQLTDRSLVATVADALERSGLPAASLCLEITEGSIIKDYDATVPVLNALRGLGVKLALDDFGTGYSSLSYLKRLPVNSVKIDRSFVSDLDSDSPNGHIVSAIIDLAHALGLSVTAEGAETHGQLRVLEEMGSDQVQGFLLGKPMPGAELAHRMTQSTVPAPRSADEVSAQL